uniref:Uncharacterized protein n=1 Tax=Plectus sambesii TaxID=2011161 RepID=A0A914WF29_9BILA
MRFTLSGIMRVELVRPSDGSSRTSALLKCSRVSLLHCTRLTRPIQLLCCDGIELCRPLREGGIGGVRRRWRLQCGRQFCTRLNTAADNCVLAGRNRTIEDGRRAASAVVVVVVTAGRHTETVGRYADEMRAVLSRASFKLSPRLCLRQRIARLRRRASPVIASLRFSLCIMAAPTHAAGPAADPRPVDDGALDYCANPRPARIG